MKIVRALAFVLALLSVHASAAPSPQQKKIYIAHDDHTDYMWTTDAAGFRQAFLQMLDYYLALAESTAGEPPAYQSRFNADGTFWLLEYERNKSAAELARLVNRIKSGHIGVPITLLTLSYGAMPAEAVLRSMYYAGELERRFGLSFKLAGAQESQTLPYGVGALLAGAGAKYLAKGICGCASQVPDAWDRPHDMYWWTGPDGSRLLVKWNSMLRGNPYDIGGYAEARSTAGIIDYLDTDAGFKARHPFSVIGAFGYGGDDLKTFYDQFPVIARQKTNASRQVIVSNQTDFFEDFEAAQSAGLPSLGVSFGNEWDILVASMAELSGRVKRALEKLRAAEAMASLVSLRDAAFMPPRAAARKNAWIGLGMYFEHDWTADGPISRDARAAWQREQAASFEGYVDTLHTDARAALARMIRKEGTATRFSVFNPLGWTRTDAADFAYDGSVEIRVVDLATGQETPFQIATVDGVRCLRIWAKDVPSVGYKVFEIRSGLGIAFDSPVTASGGVLQNAAYRVTVGANGAITGILDKLRGNREMVRSIGGRAMNDLGPGEGIVTVENEGPVSATLKIVSSSPPAHTTRITLYRDSGRIDIRNEITQNFSATTTWGFGINVDQPGFRHEEVGAVIKAALVSQGGAYSDRAARYDWLTLNHFVDCGDGAAGLTLSNGDCYFMKLGTSAAKTLDAATPLISVLAGGQVDGPGLGIPNQGGDTSFLQRFALRTRDAYDPAAAMRFALEHQNPFVVAEVAGDRPAYPANALSLLGVDSPDVLLWAVKPAEDDAAGALVVRSWNVAAAGRNVHLTLGDGTITAAQRTSHIETPGAALTPNGASLALSFAPGQWLTCRLEVTGAGDGLPVIALSKTTFRFGAERNGVPTQAGTSTVSNSGQGTLVWAAVPSDDWLSVSPASGMATGVLTIAIARTDMAPGSYVGTVTVSAPYAVNSPRTIQISLQVLPVGGTAGPFGHFDTPADGSSVSSSIAVTGWALDDIETTGVKIYRSPVGAEPAGARVFIGDAVFVEGARTDVELDYPNAPLSSRAGWGYMLLTNFLPNGGNGTYTLHAYATDREGHEVLLGSKTITCDNAHAVKPFGAIDLPAQGATISGSAYINGGWALTPPANSIPTDGSTIWVWVDGIALGHPSYNHYRDDIATLFPGYANSNGAVGVYTLDTTTFANGVHTIAWSVVDNAGNEDGIGSRYFTILNTALSEGGVRSQHKTFGSTSLSEAGRAASGIAGPFPSLNELRSLRDISSLPIYTRRGFDRSRPPDRFLHSSGGQGQATGSSPGERSLLRIHGLERLEILLDDRAFSADAERRLAESAGLTPSPRPPSSQVLAGNLDSSSGKPAPRWEGYLVVGDELRPLPIGSSLDPVTGIFSWLPGPAFLGVYRLLFVNRTSKIRLSIAIHIQP